jgi:hypothetical protein
MKKTNLHCTYILNLLRFFIVCLYVCIVCGDPVSKMRGLESQ